ncbi:hypothetical protein TNIN_477091 [Trichonephila inaurata madagascariensis]|uniref:Uncharacterized protein n=1 Tax=Trichonephila inaurata madagascariensis TaxID=2747483 RepID=A0A8X6YTX7_9ARAC|nr:hypothetical protein TNIN_477091 [Trichonephila inaurata madagascariensis]
MEVDKASAATGSQPSEEVIALSNSFSAIALIEESDEDINDVSAPNTEEEISTLQAPVEDPANINMEDEQENSDEPQLADNASGLTSSSKEDNQQKKNALANCY